MMWKRILKYYMGLPFVMRVEDIQAEIRKADVVSFDIFDTLIKRDVKSPIDIFVKVESVYNQNSANRIDNFKQKRIEAENRARKASAYEEITLKDIYDCLNGCVCNKRNLMNIEEMAEIETCILNEEMKELYEYTLRIKKPVIITSDMYLSEEIIKKILGKCGYQNYDKLYLSSVYRKTKSRGTIFRLIKEEFHDKKIVHIGDDFKADYVQANRNGITGVLINRKYS